MCLESKQKKKGPLSDQEDSAFHPSFFFTCDRRCVTAVASVSDCDSSSSTSWIVGVTAEGGREVFFFLFLCLLSVLDAHLRVR